MTTSRRVNFVSYRGRVDRRLRAVYIRNLQEAIRIWQRAMLQQLSGQRTGRVYRVPGTRATYTASSERESPAVRTGALRRSYYTEVNRNRYEAFLGSELDYSLFLEIGTSRMAPRKALEPAFERVRAQIRAALARRA